MLLGIIIGLVVGTVITIFALGMVSVRDTLQNVIQNKVMAATAFLGLMGVAAVFQGWILASLVCILLLCALIVYSKVSAGSELGTRLRLMQFRIEVAIAEAQNAIGDKLDTLGVDKDAQQDVNDIIKEKANEIRVDDEDFQQALKNGKWRGNSLVLETRDDEEDDNEQQNAKGKNKKRKS